MFKAWQLRAIRAAINWSQGQLAQRAGLTQPTISGLEKGEIESPGLKAISAIVTACQSEGFYFSDHGIEKKEANTYTIEGGDCYLQILKIAQSEMKAGDTFLKTNADERKSSPEVIAQLQHMRDSGILFQSLVRPGDAHVMGEITEYRWLDERVHQQGDVKIIFGDRVAYLVSWNDPPKIIVIQDPVIAGEARRTFDYIWQHSKQLETSTAPIRFDGVVDG